MDFLKSRVYCTDLMMHDFELHEFFHSPKNVHLKALLYISTLDGAIFGIEYFGAP